MISVALWPRNGRTPVAISYSTTPSENRSLGGPTVSPRACSGDMYNTGAHRRARSRHLFHARDGSVVVRFHAGARRAGGTLGQTEVQQLRLAVLGHEDVRGLDVAMGDALVMRGLQRVGNLSSEREHAAKRQGLGGNLLLQGPAPHQLHHQERPALLFPDVVRATDVGMVQRRRGARLARNLSEVPPRCLQGPPAGT